MGKRSTPKEFDPKLFAAHEIAETRRLRRQRALFIPRFLRDVAKAESLRGAAQDHAHSIAVRWADLHASGRLFQHKETTIDTQFLDQLFGEGLGYELKTINPDAYTLEHKFPVSGVGIADAAIGLFPKEKTPYAVIELKGAKTDLDRDKSNGRTAVQQCWDYMNAIPTCQWGIVSNFALIRLYHKSKGTLSYEEFAIEELRDRDRFNQFYALFERGGLLPSKLSQVPRAAALLEKTVRRQKEVGDELYNEYQFKRLELIEYLYRHERKDLDEAIRIAQKLLDRIIFIAFCEDRELLPERCLERASKDIPAFSKVTNPRWHNFLGLFHAVNNGSDGTPKIDRFNGGLFAEDPGVDDLDLQDEPWATAFSGFGRYDFSEEVNVEVLGHLFERSITELEKLRVGGLYALKANARPESIAARGRKATSRKSRPAPAAPEPDAISKMPKSAQRKKFGIYYTPPAFTSLIVERTVEAIVSERFAAIATEFQINPDQVGEAPAPTQLKYWKECHKALKSITVCDPACGSGAFLIRAYDALDAQYKAVVHGLAGAGESPESVEQAEDAIPNDILTHNLYGVDLSREGVEITQLALWIRSARKGKTLADLSANIVHGNSLVSDPEVDPKALNWRSTFPSVFEDPNSGFTCIIGNPPWERVKVQDREFFSLTDPETAGAVNASDRKKRIAAMPKINPELHASYLKAVEAATAISGYARKPAKSGGRYPLTGRGDINLYMLFAELARSLVAPDGLVGLLVPSGIATDDTTKHFFNDLMGSKRLASLYDFENKEAHFEDVHRSFKFTALIFGGIERTTEQADFVFFARNVEETAPHNKQRHIPLTAADMALLNPNTRTCPIFRTRRDADLTRAIYDRVPVLIDHNRKSGGNPWDIKFFTMFHQTNDAAHFKPASHWEKKGYTLSAGIYTSGKKRALPLYEAKMVQAYDHRAASVIVKDGNWVRQGQIIETRPVEHQNPEFTVTPRWWVDESKVNKSLDGHPGNVGWFLAYKDVTSATNERTMIASFIPRVGVVNSAPLILTPQTMNPRLECCLLANLNSIVYDFVARQKVGSVHLNFFIVEQLPTLPPDAYADPCPWSPKHTLESWISERVLCLSCTAEDIKQLALAAGFEGSKGGGIQAWKEQERTRLRAELDAAYAHLYGLTEDDLAYILTTFNGMRQDTIDHTLENFRDLAIAANHRL